MWPYSDLSDEFADPSFIVWIRTSSSSMVQKISTAEKNQTRRNVALLASQSNVAFLSLIRCICRSVFYGWDQHINQADGKRKCKQLQENQTCTNVASLAYQNNAAFILLIRCICRSVFHGLDQHIIQLNDKWKFQQLEKLTVGLICPIPVLAIGFWTFPQRFDKQMVAWWCSLLSS